VRDVRQFLGLTFALSWGVGGAYLAIRAFAPGLAPLDFANPLFLLINCAPSLAAFALTARRLGRGGALALLAQLWRPFALPWLLVAALFLPLVCVLAGNLGPVPLAALPLLFLDSAAWGEEFGWRGYLLPRLLARMGVLPASLLVGAVWTLWHLPGFFLSGVMRVGMGDFLWWALGTMALSLVMGVLSWRANGNLAVAGIIPHALINAAAREGFWHSSPREVLLLTVFALGFYWFCGAKPARPAAP
jgi:membrane protease YdiL (CAAX protease family)